MPNQRLDERGGVPALLPWHAPSLWHRHRGVLSTVTFVSEARGLGQPVCEWLRASLRAGPTGSRRHLQSAPPSMCKPLEVRRRPKTARSGDSGWNSRFTPPRRPRPTCLSRRSNHALTNPAPHPAEPWTLPAPPRAGRRQLEPPPPPVLHPPRCCGPSMEAGPVLPHPLRLEAPWEPSPRTVRRWPGSRSSAPTRRQPRAPPPPAPPCPAAASTACLPGGPPPRRHPRPAAA